VGVLFAPLSGRVRLLMNKTEARMIDPSDMELAAMRACLSPLGEYVGSIGMQRPLADYSRDEVLMLIDVVVTAYQDQMLVEHERMAAKTAPSLRNAWHVRAGISERSAVLMLDFNHRPKIHEQISELIDAALPAIATAKPTHLPRRVAARCRLRARAPVRVPEDPG
jgi:hypothetical protein